LAITARLLVISLCGKLIANKASLRLYEMLGGNVDMVRAHNQSAWLLTGVNPEYWQVELWCEEPHPSVTIRVSFAGLTTALLYILNVSFYSVGNQA
jgi:hypothetical protein